MTTASESIRRQVEAALPAQYRPLDSWSAPRTREWSWHIDATGAGSRLLVKISRWEGVETLEKAMAAGAQRDTEGEFAAMVSIAEAVERSGDEGLAAVRPVAYVPEVNAIVLEWLEASPLGARLTRAASARTARTLLERAGRWLRVGHEALGPSIVGPLDGHAAWSGWQAAIARMSRVPRGLREGAEVVAGVGERLHGRPTRSGTIHGDFSLRNVLVTGDGRVAVIDPNRYQGPLVVDPATLAAELMVGRWRLATGGTFPGTARIHRWVRWLLDGYGDHDAEVFAYECAVAVMGRWLALEAYTSPGRRLAVAANRRLFRYEVARLAA